MKFEKDSLIVHEWGKGQKMAELWKYAKTVSVKPEVASDPTKMTKVLSRAQQANMHICTICFEDAATPLSGDGEC